MEPDEDIIAKGTFIIQFGRKDGEFFGKEEVFYEKLILILYLLMCCKQMAIKKI